MEAQYPAHWEADVVLSDGGTAHVRPIRPADADRLRTFYSRLSEESIYFRFFGPRPRLSDREVTRFTNVDYVDRVALIATIGTEMVAVIRYDRIDAEEAEVAFLVEDAHQGRGVASVLLEHLAETARENGIARFVADVLPANQKMMGVLKQAGYTAQSRFADGVVRMTLDLTPTETSQAVTASREHRAEARSIERLLTPGSVAVVGAGREPGGVGQTVLRNLLGADFTGPVYPVHREARAVAGVRAYPSVTAIDGEVDLAVLAVPADGVIDVVKECAEKGVRGLIVVSSGFGETGPEGRARQDELVRIARAYGLRVVGPNCLGIANTDPAVRLNATLAATVPGRGRVGFFSQSGALGTALLQRVAQRGMGISSFVSAGNRADVSGNDLLQYWEEDAATDVILLYLESLGNPRKFARLARRISRRKPIVVVKSGGTTQGVPTGHAAQVLGLPDTALSALFEQAGVIRVDDLIQQFDVAQLLAHQPLPAGPRVGLVGNSDALALLAVDACARAGLEPRPPVNLGARAGAAEFGAALAALLPEVDAAVAIYMPPIPGRAAEVAAELLRVAREGGKPVLATFEGQLGMPAELRVGAEVPERGSIPSYAAPEEAVRALAHVVRYARWRERPAGVPVEEPGVDAAAARGLVERLLAAPADAPPAGAAESRAVPAAAAGEGAERVLSEAEVAELLAHYGLTVWRAEVVASPEAAVDAAERLGWPVVLKAADPEAAKRAGTVRLGLAGPDGVRDAFADLLRQLGPDAVLAVQRMVPQPAVPTVVNVVEDPGFGAVVSFGLGEVTARLLRDEAYRLAPLTREDAAELVESPRAAPLLFGEYGYPPVAVEALEELLVRVGRLADDLPEVAGLDLDPVLVGESEVVVLGARAVLRHPGGPRPDGGPRRLS
ncbi:bifunctional acetate--CoA ligase family protein/GNAT family N-acetyltransferase [Planomonospora parontospora]|uniref:bifunctional acetate--CoA ligase family protein/GNAT family N-acetyltransferase n=1 Tax=Planomonospora parontospora TaxID=58119 RepID=UPI0019870861|nr:bifunctional GNAT family N-acetyltransferase/acetate--CoA ligase family protein [Planomonospora parontospora]GGL18924.1 GNAT family N-acetyltransferase [Planomonospora parontospora subsp. antibiotica]GII15501.1 GNAT family N-acetyltransferase [Planomonospora parontospora subsp. antibiotica]